MKENMKLEDVKAELDGLAEGGRAKVKAGIFYTREDLNTAFQAVGTIKKSDVADAERAVADSGKAG